MNYTIEKFLEFLEQEKKVIHKLDVTEYVDIPNYYALKIKEFMEEEQELIIKNQQK